MDLVELFATARERHPDRVALEPGSGSGAVTYRELFARVDRLASGLAATGLAAGDRVAFYLGGRVEFVVAYLAVVRLGAVMVPMNLAYRSRELSHILTDAEPRMVVTEGERLPVLEALDATARASVETILAVETLAAMERDPAALPAVAVAADSPALLLYTSGTTGASKGAVLRHGNVVAAVESLLEAWEWSCADRLLLTLPIFHTHGLIVGLHCALAAGAAVLLRSRFDAAAVVDELTAAAATLFFGVPTMYARLIGELEARTARPDLSRIRLFCSGSAPLPAESFAAFRRLTGHAILERYGMTETGMLLSNPYRGERIAGTVGTPLPGVEARIVADDGEPVADGAEGELQVRGANVFSGYWRAAAKTAESFVEDVAGNTWFRTGDLARRDPATGHHVLLGRRHELILSGGYNVYPREIEEALLEHPAVREVAVVGRTHREWGEAPVAFLVLAGEAREEDLIEHCRSQMAAYKVPRRMRFVDELPRNALGKVQKHLLPA